MSNLANITVSTTINASVEKVWEVFNSPEHNVIWNTGHPDWHTPKSTNDLRVGGAFCHTMAAKDGSLSFDFNGTYNIVKPYELVDYTIEGGRHVQVVFESIGASAKLTEIFEPETENSEELQQAGWQGILDNLKRYIESL
jgi:uncharacterized protein YndB with AHSA1/START domain